MGLPVPMPTLDPDFDIADAREAVGDFTCGGITADERNDCDHVPVYSTFTNVTTCMHCGRRLDR